ncbi:MAG: phosphoribosyl-AMP cyclohydrolase [Spirochaetota bacterium]|nr:phosphoribosyl-AMP cyclohydrolase [Spirochaetota bacterium]
MVEIDFEKGNGLVPVIAQDFKTNEVLMMAYMNQEAWEMTLRTGIAHYHSRSRGQLWKKGESSGNIQEVKEIRLDCDNDCILLKINQIGDAACHTGYRSCFYRVIDKGELRIDDVKIFDPKDRYGE